MVIEEGKMGKKDSDRAEGQYKMKKGVDDPQLARQQAIDQARKAGILGSAALRHGGAFASLGDHFNNKAKLAELHHPSVIVAPTPGATAVTIPADVAVADRRARAVARRHISYLAAHPRSRHPTT